MDAKEKNKLKVETWPIDRLIPYARNPRRNDEQVERMASAIREFGFRIPVVAKSDGSVVDGHLRLKAAQKLGLKEVPVALADELTDAQVKAFRLLANKSANWAEWDDNLLRCELEELQEMAFDLSLTGFDAPELDAVLNVADGGTGGLTDPDACPEVQETPVTNAGDVWLLGRHRLMCGDSTDAGSVCQLMQNEKADMVFTSPPYNANAAAIAAGKKFASHKKINVDMYGGKKNDDKDSDEYIDFTKKVLKTCVENTHGMIYWNCNYNAKSKFEYIAQIIDFLPLLVDQICWKKHLTITNTGGGFTRIWEPIYIFCTLDKPFKLAEVAMNFWEVDNVGATVGEHHACFPVALPLKALNLYGNQVKTVFEPFCGAGSTMIACEQKGVACYGMELEPRFCDVIVRRWQDFTGQKATLESSGKTFDEVADGRA